MKPWDAIIPQHEQEAYRAAGFGRRTGLGSRPALLIIDVQYRTVGTEPRPFFDAIKEFPTACGQIGWDAVHQIARVLALFRAKGWPVLYPYVSQKETFDKGRLADKVPALMTVAKRGYDFVAEVAPEPNDVLLPKKHPSAFFGTPLASYLIERAHRYAGGHRLHHQRLRARDRSRRFCLQFPRPRAARVRLRPQSGVACGQPVRHVGKIRGRGEYR